MSSREKIVKGCLKGSRKHQDMLYEMFHYQVMGICLRYSKSNQDAEDIFQEAFIKIFNQLNSLRDVEALSKWISQVTVRVAINHYRKYAAKEKANIRLEEEFEVLNDDYQSLLDQIENESLIKILNDMPGGYRVVFNLYVVEGYKHREIADQLDISINTSKSQLRDAKAYLKSELIKLGIERYEVA